MKRFFLYFLPFVVSFTIGVVLYLLSIVFVFNNDVKSLLSNISSALLAMPVIFLCYDLINKFSKRRLHKEIFDYAKMQVDRYILSIVFQLIGALYPISGKKVTLQQVREFLEINQQELKAVLKKNGKIGFQVLRNFDSNEHELQDILKNPYAINSLDENKIISIIKLLKSLSYLQSLISSYGLFLPDKGFEENLKIVSGKKLGEHNYNFPNRYLLLKPLPSSLYYVVAFGDFAGYKEKELLRYYKINPSMEDEYIEAVADLIRAINSWLDSTGKEFIVDTRMFKIREMVVEGWTKDVVGDL